MNGNRVNSWAIRKHSRKRFFIFGLVLFIFIAAVLCAYFVPVPGWGRTLTGRTYPSVGSQGGQSSATQTITAYTPDKKVSYRIPANWNVSNTPDAGYFYEEITSSNTTTEPNTCAHTDIIADGQTPPRTTVSGNSIYPRCNDSRQRVSC